MAHNCSNEKVCVEMVELNLPSIDFSTLQLWGRDTHWLDRALQILIISQVSNALVMLSRSLEMKFPVLATVLLP